MRGPQETLGLIVTDQELPENSVNKPFLFYSHFYFLDLKSYAAIIN